ncbi:MAG: hypothetical protein BWY74_01409 [Firmicutes bacterium ADurb.Bin419]|nr:MAG: hypothetical protein BWY74_01409 [Firmicutes bacterium ADurb.Bin419]
MSIKKNILIISTLVTSFLFLTACWNKNNQTVDNSSTDSNQPIVEPTVPAHSIFRPYFELKDETTSAGTAFAVEFGEEKVPLILSSIHLFGSNGGLSKNIPSLQIPDVFKSLTLTDVFSSEPCGTVTKALGIPRAKPSSINKDVMAFMPDKDLNIAGYRTSASRNSL